MAIFSKSIGISQVASKVAGRFAENEINRSELQAQAAEAKLRKNRANLQNDPDSLQQEMDVLTANYQTILNEKAKTDTIDQFRLYIKTGNPNHLTDLFKNNEKVRNQFGGIVSIQKLDPINDVFLLTQQGIKPEDYRPGRHLKAIMSNGSAKLFDAFGVAAGTGALMALKHEELDLYNKYLKAIGKDGDTEKYAPGDIEKDATFVAATLPGQSLKSATSSLFNKKISGLEPGKQKEADKAIKDLLNTFGGEPEFFNTDFGTTSNRQLAAPWIRRYEAFSGVNLTAIDKADIKEINTLIAMASQFEENVTPETAGFFDSTFRKVKNLISDAVDKEIIDENKAASAYNAYRNLVLRALSGATLTASEVTFFKEAFGSLAQQFPAVITQFQTALTQLKSKLSSVADLNDPYLAHYYMRNSPEQIGKMINSLDIMLEQFSQEKGNLPGEVIDIPDNEDLDKPALTKEQFEQSMEDVFGALQ